MLRKTLTILSLIGLLLSVGLWGVSYHLRPRFCWVSLTATRMCISSRGAMIFVAYDEKRRSLSGWAFLGFDQQGYETFLKPEVRIPWGRAALRVVAPLWIPTVLFSAYPLYLKSGVHRRRERKKLGLCLKCGYDLRASKDRCPECGESFE